MKCEVTIIEFPFVKLNYDNLYYYYINNRSVYNLGNLSIAYDKIRTVSLGKSTTTENLISRKLLVQTDRAQDRIYNSVGIAIRTGPPILKVSTAVVGHSARNSNGGTSIGDSCTEVCDVAGLVQPGQTTLVVLSAVRVISTDVSVVRLGQLLHGSLNGPARENNYLITIISPFRPCPLALTLIHPWPSSASWTRSCVLRHHSSLLEWVSGPN